MTTCRFVDSETWRKSYAGTGVEELVRTFDYKERPEVFKFYPQYYHKTDKVRLRLHTAPTVCAATNCPSAGWPTALH